MTPIEAREIAVEIHDSWPSGHHVTVDVWAAELVPLRAQIARDAIVRLRRETSRPPGISEFRGAYAVCAPEPPRERPDYSDAISLDRHIANLEARASRDPGAADELEVWRRRGRDVAPALRLDLGGDE